jgi:hypothetical protein
MKRDNANTKLEKKLFCAGYLEELIVIKLVMEFTYPDLLKPVQILKCSLSL